MAGDTSLVDVGDWLASLGLGHFAETFAENGIDSDLLPELTNEDLKDLGVARLADRKRLLKAISGHSDGTSAPTSTGERRQVTGSRGVRR